MTSAVHLVPHGVAARATNRARWERDVQEYVELPAAALIGVVHNCLKNVGRVERHTPDGVLRTVVVPELCERIVSGSRETLRRLETTLAEYFPDLLKPSLFGKLPCAELVRDAGTLRAHIAEAARLDARALTECLRFLIAGSASSRWAPDDFVYEPALVYRIAPALAWRVLHGVK